MFEVGKGKKNTGLHGEWDQAKSGKEKDIRKAGLSSSIANGYKGYDPSVWITDKDTEEDRKIKLERQKKIDQLPMKKTIHIDLELERADCSGCYQFTEESEFELAKLLRKEKFNVEYSSEGFIQALNFQNPIDPRNLEFTCEPDPSERRSSFYENWKKYIEEGDLPDMSELFNRLMTTEEMKMIIRKAAQEAGKDLDESQLNLLSSDQNLAKAYVKPILDAMQAKH